MSRGDRVPQFYDLLNPTLEVLHELGGSGTIQEIDQAIVDELALPPKIAELPHRRAPTKLQYRAAWARTGLRILGLIENSAQVKSELTDDLKESCD